jgi:hypothetical protein
MSLAGPGFRRRDPEGIAVPVVVVVGIGDGRVSHCRPLVHEAVRVARRVPGL